MKKLIAVCLVTVFAGACREDASQPTVALSLLPAFRSAAPVAPPAAGRVREAAAQGASRGARDGSDDPVTNDAVRRPGESVEAFVSRLVSEMQPCSRSTHLIQGTRFEACGVRRSGYGYAMLYRPEAVAVDGADTVTVYVCHDAMTHLACREGALERDRTTHVAVRVSGPAGGPYWRHAHVRWSDDPCGTCRPATPAAPAARTYGSCTELRRDWNDGIRSDPDSWEPYPYPASWTSAERETYLLNVTEHGEGGGETDYEHPLDSNEDGTFCDVGDSAEPLSPGPPPKPADHDSCSALLAVWNAGVRHDASDWDAYPYPDLDSWWTAEETAYARNEDLDDDGGPGVGDGHACGPGDTGVNAGSGP